MLQVKDGDTPDSPGLYVVYTDSPLGLTFTVRKLLMWADGKWGYPSSDQNYRGPVYAYLGPLPIMVLPK